MVVVAVAGVMLGLAARPGMRTGGDAASKDHRTGVGRVLEKMSRGAIDVSLVDAGGVTVARARIEVDGTTALNVGELAATQQGSDLRLAVGVVPGVPSVDRGALIAAAAGSGRLVGDHMEIDVGDGGLLVLRPA